MTTFETVVVCATGIPLLFVVVVSVLSIAHGRREKREQQALRRAVVEEPCTHSTAQWVPILGTDQYGVVCGTCPYVRYPPPGEFTADEREHITYMNSNGSIDTEALRNNPNTMRMRWDS